MFFFLFFLFLPFFFDSANDTFFSSTFRGWQVENLCCVLMGQRGGLLCRGRALHSLQLRPKPCISDKSQRCVILHLWGAVVTLSYISFSFSWFRMLFYLLCRKKLQENWVLAFRIVSGALFLSFLAEQWWLHSWLIGSKSCCWWSDGITLGWHHHWWHLHACCFDVFVVLVLQNLNKVASIILAWNKCFCLTFHACIVHACWNNAKN